MSEPINKELREALQAFLDCAPIGDGNRCFYCEARVYGANDTDEHSPDCEIVKGQIALAKSAKVAQPAVAEPDTPETLAREIEALQRRANTAVRAAKLKGDEFHPLNVIDLGLFGLLMQAKNAAGMFPKAEEDQCQ